MVIDSERVWLLPTITVPKLRLDGFAPKVPGVTPVPERGIVKVGLEAFEVTLMLPLAAPPAAGENVTLKVAICPAFRVTGAVIPLRVKPVPLMAT